MIENKNKFEDTAGVLNKTACQFAEFKAIQNGVQAFIKGQSTKLTFYYSRPCKYHLSTSGAMVFFSPGSEILVVKKYYNREPEKAKHSDIDAKKEISNPFIVEPTDKGTESCINHLKAKLDKYNKVNPDRSTNECCTMLKTLIIELEQYL